MSKPSVAVVILNWNGRKFLEKFLPSVLSSTYSNMEIIIADNASTDDSVAFIQSNENENQLKELNLNLPAYMFPKKVIYLQEFPLNSNGKIDRKKLIKIANQF